MMRRRGRINALREGRVSMINVLRGRSLGRINALCKLIVDALKLNDLIGGSADAERAEVAEPHWTKSRDKRDVASTAVPPRAGVRARGVLNTRR